MYTYMFPIMKFYIGCIRVYLYNNVNTLAVKEFAWPG
jgi:hypothetical protein